MSKQVGIVCAYLVSGYAMGQAFPIQPITEPVYPSNVPALSEFEWVDGEGVLTRLGDMNNDGVDDLLVLFNGPGVLRIPETRVLWLYTRNSDGSLNQPEFLDGFGLSSHTRITDFVILDHDGDGYNDITIMTDAGRYLHTWLTQAGGFVQGPVYDLGITRTPDQIARLELLDINDDARDDYVIWCDDERLDAWVTQPDGSRAHRLLSDESMFQSEESRTVYTDADGDGDRDFIIASPSNTPVWLENTGELFVMRYEWLPPVTNFSFSNEVFAFADVNGDGLKDFLGDGVAFDVGREGYGFILAPFNLTTPRTIPTMPFPEWHRGFGFSFSPQPWAEYIQSPGDLDGDGTDDLVIFGQHDYRRGWLITDPMNINGRRAYSWMHSVHGLGSFDAVSYDYDEQYSFRDVYFDTNNDGIKDRICVTTARAYVDLDWTGPDPNGVMLWSVLTNPYDTGYLSDPRDAENIPEASSFLETDLDRDGSPELMLTQSFNMSLLDIDADDYLVSNWSTSFAGYRAGFRTIEAQLDDNPGIELVSNGNSNHDAFPVIYPNAVAGPFGVETVNEPIPFDPSQILSDAGIEFYPELATFDVGDVNGDGLDDVIIRGDDRETPAGPRTLLVWLNHGDFSFSLSAPIEVGGGESEPVDCIRLIDEDHDGDLDLINIAGDRDFETLQIYHNDGTGSFIYNREFSLHRYNGLRHYGMIIEDTDLDGWLDVVLVLQDRRSESELAVVYGGPEGLDATPKYFAGIGAAEVLCEDINFDSYPDLVTCAYECPGDLKPSITIYYQTAPRQFAPGVAIDSTYFSAISWFDINQDGTRDLIAGEYNEPHIYRFLSLPQQCLADLNLDKQLNFFDIALFIQQYSAGRRLADLNRDDRLDFFDVAEMIASYTQGCP